MARTPWVAAPPEARAGLRRAHELVVGDHAPAPGLRRLVEESWHRSLDLALDPDGILARLAIPEDELLEYRAGHQLSRVLPVIQRLLVRHTLDAGLIVAVGDAAGRLLWIDGDRGLRRAAEGMLFVEGADWSESRVGTSAPGTALTLDHGIQITGAEHFGRIVHPWSCTAVPVHDPIEGGLIGVIDITGGDDAVAPGTLPLVEATVAAVEAELCLLHLDGRPSPGRRTRTVAAHPALHVLGRETGELEHDGRIDELSLRHAEILTLLAWNRGGLRADSLAELVYGRPDAEVTLRAEMFRLRRVLPPGLGPLSRPYRLAGDLELDVTRVLAFLARGAYRVALGAYPGPLLPRSDAPGIVAIRDDLRIQVRESILEGGSAETLLEFARSVDGDDDLEVWRAVLRALPTRSPKRAQVVTRIERLEAEQRR